MSTRATYRFITKDEGTTTFYIHHDGCQEGAAHYLSNAFENFSATNFFRKKNNLEHLKIPNAPIGIIEQIILKTATVACLFTLQLVSRNDIRRVAVAA